MRVFTGLDQRQRVQIGPVMAPVHNVVAFLGLSVLSAALACVSIAIGSIELDFWDVLRVVSGGPATEDERFAVFTVRLPRILVGFMVGWVLAMAGATLQSLAQNPLAEPGLLGLSQGALLAIMLTMVFFPAVPRPYYPVIAMCGGLAVGVSLLLLVGRHNAGGIAILLMGIAVQTTLSSVSMMLLLYTPQEESYQLARWMNGSLYYSTWENVARFGWWFGASVVALLLVGRSLNVFDLGDQMAMSLGEPASWSKPAILIVASTITAASVSLVGPIVFVGILAPHLANSVSRATGASRLLLASVMGGLLIMSADLLTRVTTTYAYLPIGLTIVIIGAPAFILTVRFAAIREAR
ncbi:MAG: iron ABC transporter permease [Pseudomonadota bacterium]